MNAVVFYIGSNYYGNNNNNNNNNNYISKNEIELSKNEYPNITFASHSYNLHTESSRYNSQKEIDDDFYKYSQISNTKYFAYPYGFISKKIKKSLRKYNYKLAFTFGPRREHRKSKIEDDNYMIPRLNISNNMSLLKFIIRLNMPF